MCFAQLAADASQRVAGAIQHFAALVDAAADLIDDRLWRVHAHGDIRHMREAIGDPAEGAVERPCALQGVADADEVRRQNGTAAQRLLHQRSQVMHGAQVDVALLVEQSARLAGLRLPVARQADIVGGLQCMHTLLADRERSEASELLEDLVEFEQPQSSPMHRASIAQGNIRMKLREMRVAPYTLHMVSSQRIL